MSLRFDEARKAWSDCHLPLAVEVIKSQLQAFVNLTTAPIEDDIAGIDMFITIPSRWAIRFRKAKYFRKYGDVTFRLTPTQSELDKLDNVDCMFYAWVEDDGCDLAGWVIIDVARIRSQVREMVTTVTPVPGGNRLAAIPLDKLMAAGGIMAMSRSVAERLSKKL